MASSPITLQLPAGSPTGAQQCAEPLFLLLVAALCLQIYSSEEPGCEPALPAASCPPEGQGQGGQEEWQGLLLPHPPTLPSPLLAGEEEGAAAEATKTGEVLLLSDRDGRGPRVRPDTDTHTGQPDPNPSSDPDRCRPERGVRDSWAETPVAPYREGQADSHEAPQRLSEIRIVLLGERLSEKSSAGNTILGREEFVTEGVTEECVKREGEVAGRQITVVDTPGYSSFPRIIRTDPQHVREEVVRSVSLCPPGPHALLLVIDLDSATDWRSVKKYLELLSERVWRHTIVLFTWGDTLRDITIEQHIEREGKKLQYLVEKCGNRYHVLNNKNRGDRTQVTELLEKIEDMVAGNYGLYFTTDIKEINTEREIEKPRQREEERQRETGAETEVGGGETERDRGAETEGGGETERDRGAETEGGGETEELIQRDRGAETEGGGETERDRGAETEGGGEREFNQTLFDRKKTKVLIKGFKTLF
ncbi:GTPase IMAP family member 4-like [Lepisosteus oculatus]|uniref:GTPase IMAP family member 4-like n=1 Tax=Lepisosteus oculatus TaxID=7918 RepID=UPI0035F52306